MIDAARFVAGDRPGPSLEYIESLKANRAPEEIVKRAEKAFEINNTYDVLEENWDAIQLYMSVKTQWRTGGTTGQPIGLDYVAVDVAMNRLGIKNDAFCQLQIIEGEILKYWAETREQQ
ncbi:MAG: DUF1799 domain-containing protein [Candidatus Thiodiazotropha taylori]